MKLEFEREMLGTYISDHPLYEVDRQRCARRADGPIVSIRERGGGTRRAAAKAVTVGGILDRGPDSPDQGQRALRPGRARGPRRFARDQLLGRQLSRSSAGFSPRTPSSLIKVRVSDNDEELRFSAVDVERFRAGARSNANCASRFAPRT